MQWQTEEDWEGERLDVFLTAHTDMTRSRASSLIRDGRCTVDGIAAKKCGLSLREGQSICLDVPEVRPAHLEAQNIPLEIVYQDSDLAVVNKPSGMVVHPAPGNPDGTMVNALLYHLDGLSGIGGELRPGIVHRIDRDTSGLLLVAKNDKSHLALSEQIRAHSVKRAYLAVLQGCPRVNTGEVEAPIGRHPTERKKMAIVPEGRYALTHWKVLEPMKGTSLIEARLETGRTHQIRVHMASIGYPVLGDMVYGPKKPLYPVKGGQLLHAYQLGFVHPTTGKEMLFSRDPEPRFLEWLHKLGGKWPLQDETEQEWL